MKNIIPLLMLSVMGCGDDSVDPFVNIYPFLVQSSPCRGSILSPAENVTIQQGETKGPYYSRDFTSACFIVTTTTASTISITTTPASNAEIIFRSSDLTAYNSNYQIDPVATVPVALSSAEVQISSVSKFDFMIDVN